MKLIVKDKYLISVFGLSFAVLIFVFLLALFKLSGVSAPLIIHFDVYRGVDFFGGKADFFGVLISAGAMISINAFLADFLYLRERFLSYIIGFFSLEFAVLILIAMSVIISVN